MQLPQKSSGLDYGTLILSVRLENYRIKLNLP